MTFFRFADPWLLALLLIPVLVWWWRPRRGGATFPGFALAMEALRPSRGPLIFQLLLGAGLALLVIAAARPQAGRAIVEREQAGRDLMLVIDLSASMTVDDLESAEGRRIDRLSAVMTAAQKFVAGRPNDRIGLVFFSSQALTSCPLTYDHETVAQFLERTERQQRALWDAGRQGGLLGPATNLGLGLGTALRGLKEANSRGRAIVLITDGADSRDMPGWVDPLVAARHAAAIGARVHGIGVGNPDGLMTMEDRRTGRMVRQPVTRQWLPDLVRLRAITDAGGGRSFAANDRPALEETFKRIDELEPTPRSVRQRDDYADRFVLPLVLGLSLLALALAFEPRLRGVA